MTNQFIKTMKDLTPMQRSAVELDSGPVMVLAGPGSGKTRVLTCRIARLLESSPGERFRVLGLTFTNKAAHEMKTRIEELVPDALDRAEIRTIHGFCTQVLRQHGVHCNVKPNFEIYARTADRQAVLEDALRDDHEKFTYDEVRFLPPIDTLKSRLIKPEQAKTYLQNESSLPQEIVEQISLAYKLYEARLQISNALDFNSLIQLAFELFNYPVVVRHYQIVYRHLLIDELHHTNSAQYKLLKQMTAGNFQNIFAVADDDQTVHEWNFASVQRISDFVRDFECDKVIQLTDNFRCPPKVVDAANRLLVYNVRRDASKATTAAKTYHSEDYHPEIGIRVFDDDGTEARQIAEEIAQLGGVERQRTVVLGRSRALLEPLGAALTALDVPLNNLGRRDDFASPQALWLLAYLKQINRPLDRRNLISLTNCFANFTECPFDAEDVILRSETCQITVLSAWLSEVQRTMPDCFEYVDTIGGLKFSKMLEHVAKSFGSQDVDIALDEDLSAWRKIVRDVRADNRSLKLDQFLQEVELSSKEPNPIAGSVNLGTVHGAKGMEFDTVYLIGLAEEVFPSWHSVKKGDGSAAIEEERRNCFVAITRAKERLILSRAKSYKSWPKAPSRFLREMGLAAG